MQYYRSKSLAGLHYKSKYKLKTYTNLNEPLVIFGMYREEDYQTLINHESEVIIVWQGSDAKDLPIKWTDVDSICKSIMKEYENRNNDNKQVSKDFIKFINDNKL